MKKMSAENFSLSDVFIQVPGIKMVLVEFLYESRYQRTVSPYRSDNLHIMLWPVNFVQPCRLTRIIILGKSNRLYCAA